MLSASERGCVKVLSLEEEEEEDLGCREVYKLGFSQNLCWQDFYDFRMNEPSTRTAA